MTQNVLTMKDFLVNFDRLEFNTVESAKKIK